MRHRTAVGGLVAAGLCLAIASAPAAAQPTECAAARANVPRLLAEMPPPVGAEAGQTLAAAAKRGLTRADGYDALSAASMLRGEMPAAASAALQALTLEWVARHAANLGVTFIYLSRYDEAAGFLTCARELDPDLVFAIEAQALLAHRRRNCSEATRLIGEAAARMPGDANVHYSAGVIHYRCGDRTGAAAELRTAVDIAPADGVMAQALAVAGAGAPPPKPTPTPKAVRKKIDELFRFMDESIATADRESRLLRRVTLAMGHRDTSDVDIDLERLKNGVATRKAFILQLEASTASLARMMGPDIWNGLLDQSVRSYFQTTLDLYHARAAGSGVIQAVLMGAALGQEPAALAGRARTNGYVIQDGPLPTPYEKIVRANTNIPGVGTNCAPIQEGYRVYAERVEGNLHALDDGFPRASADYANLWLSYAEQAADYAKRTAGVTRFAANDASGSARWVANIQAAYGSTVRNALLGDVAGFLRASQRLAATEVREAPHHLESARIRECDTEPVEAATLADAVERLMEAFDTAGTYDASLNTPDCTIGIGSVKVSCKPLAFEGVKATWSGGPVKVTATAAGDRVGVDASAGAGPLSASSQGSRMNVASSKAEASDYGIKGSVGVSTWIEQNTSGQADAYVEVKGMLGAGVDVDGLATVGCDVFNASAKFNLRAFAETLAR